MCAGDFPAFLRTGMVTASLHASRISTLPVTMGRVSQGPGCLHQWCAAPIAFIGSGVFYDAGGVPGGVIHLEDIAAIGRASGIGDHRKNHCSSAGIWQQGHFICCRQSLLDAQVSVIRTDNEASTAPSGP